MGMPEGEIATSFATRFPPAAETWKNMPDLRAAAFQVYYELLGLSEVDANAKVDYLLYRGGGDGAGLARFETKFINATEPIRVLREHLFSSLPSEEPFGGSGGGGKLRW